MSLNHSEAQAALEKALETTLPVFEQQSLDEHLAGCAECREYAEALKIFDQRLASSLQKRWPAQRVAETEITSLLPEILTHLRSKIMPTRFNQFARTIAWAAAAVLLVLALSWAIRNFIPKTNPAAQETMTGVPALETQPAADEQEEIVPTPIAEEIISKPAALTPGKVALFPNAEFDFTASVPDSPKEIQIYTQVLDPALTAEDAKQTASQLGVNGPVYQGDSEGNNILFEITDRISLVRFMNFASQFFFTPGSVGVVADLGDPPPFEQQAVIAKAFLEDRGLLDMPFISEPIENIKGGVRFLPLLDGYPVRFGIGYNTSIFEWANAVVGSNRSVREVDYSGRSFQEIGEYPILTAAQAWERLSSPYPTQHSQFAVNQPVLNDYRSWVRKYPPFQFVHLYGYASSLKPVDPAQPALTIFKNAVTSGVPITPENPWDFVHVWGQFEQGEGDVTTLNVQGWEPFDASEDYLTGTVSRRDGQAYLKTNTAEYLLPDLPADVVEGASLGVSGIQSPSEPGRFEWSSVETGTPPYGFGSYNSCGGGGGGGGEENPPYFGGGSLSFLNLDIPELALPTPSPNPFQTGQTIEGLEGQANVVYHLYPGQDRIQKVYLSIWPSDQVPQGATLILSGEGLAGIEQFHSLPVRVWGAIKGIEDNLTNLQVDRFEPAYPGLQFQEVTGTQEDANLDGKDVSLMTTSQGEKFVLRSSIANNGSSMFTDSPQAVFEVEGYAIPGDSLGGYPILTDVCASYPPDGEITCATPQEADHTFESAPPELSLQGKVTIEQIELAYRAISLQYCQANRVEDQFLNQFLTVQPVWIYRGHLEDGRTFEIHIQALPDEYLQ